MFVTCNITTMKFVYFFLTRIDSLAARNSCRSPDLETIIYMAASSGGRRRSSLLSFGTGGGSGGRRGRRTGIGGNGRCYEWCLEEDENEQPKEVGNQRRIITVAGRMALGGALGLLPHGDGIEVVGIAGGDGRYLEMGRLADGCCVVLARIEWAAQLDGPPYRRSDTGGSAVVRVGDLPGRAVPPIAAATMMKVAFHFGGASS